LRRSGPSILPGGRIIAPLGEEYATGPGAFGIAVTASGRTVVTADGARFATRFTGAGTRIAGSAGKCNSGGRRRLTLPGSRARPAGTAFPWELALAGDRTI